MLVSPPSSNNANFMMVGKVYTAEVLTYAGILAGLLLVRLWRNGARSLIWAPVQSVALDAAGTPILTIPGVGQVPTTAVRKVG